MTQMIAANGVGLPLPANLYPTGLLNTNGNPQNTNQMTLAPGQAIPVPAGDWYVTLGRFCLYQQLDPVSGSWRSQAAGIADGRIRVRSDGVNHRVANLTGCPITAVVTAGGSLYVQSTTSVTATGNNSTWQAVVGGIGTSISTIVSTAGGTTVSLVGAGYGMAPLVFIPAPANPGVQATGYAQISSGTVTAYSLVNVGAGYSGTSKTVAVLPNPYDPNFLNGSITSQAQALFNTPASTSVGAVICTNSGAPPTGGVSLTIAGAGSSAVASVVMMTTITATSISVVGAGYVSDAMLMTVGGRTALVAAFANPDIQMTNFVSRPFRALAGVATSSVSLVTVDDPGLFTGTPSVQVLPQSFLTTGTIAVVGITQGGAVDTVQFQAV